MTTLSLCECGCGEPAPIRKETKRERGHVKGHPARFVCGHNNRVRQLQGRHNPAWKGGRIVTGAGYVYLHRPEHPRSTKASYVPEHVVVVEGVIGSPLPERSEVHHANETPGDNTPSNLVLCQDRAYHAFLHVRLRAFHACGDPTKRRCYSCGVWDHSTSLNSSGIHPACHARAERERYARSK